MPDWILSHDTFASSPLQGLSQGRRRIKPMHFGVASTAEKPRQWLVANCVPVPTLPLPAAVIPLKVSVETLAGKYAKL